MSQDESDMVACENDESSSCKRPDQECTKNMVKMMELLSESKVVIREMIEDRARLRKEIEELKQQTKVKSIFPQKIEDHEKEIVKPRQKIGSTVLKNVPDESLKINKKLECLQNQLRSLKILSEKQKLHEKELEKQRKMIKKYTSMYRCNRVVAEKRKEGISDDPCHTAPYSEPLNYTVQYPSLVKSCEWRNIPLRRPSEDTLLPCDKKPSDHCSKHVFLKPKNNFLGESMVQQEMSSTTINAPLGGGKSEECHPHVELFLKKTLHSAPRITFRLQNESSRNKNNNAMNFKGCIPDNFQQNASSATLALTPGKEDSNKKEDFRHPPSTFHNPTEVQSATCDVSENKKIEKVQNNSFEKRKSLRVSKQNKAKKRVEKQKRLKNGHEDMKREDARQLCTLDDVQVLQQKQMLENFLITKVQREKMKLEEDMMQYDRKLKEEKHKLASFIKICHHQKRSSAHHLYDCLVSLEQKCLSDEEENDDDEDYDTDDEGDESDETKSDVDYNKYGGAVDYDDSDDCGLDEYNQDGDGFGGCGLEGCGLGGDGNEDWKWQHQDCFL